MAIVAKMKYGPFTDPYGVGETTNPPVDYRTVTPDDANDLTDVCKALYFGAAGNVKVTTLLGTDIVIPVAANQLLVGFFKRVWSTGTTVTSGNVFSCH